MLLSYGHGAVMGVPAHDDRDFAFAKQYGLDIPVVIAGPAWDGEALSEAWTGDGRLVNSGEFDGLPVAAGQAAIAAALADRGAGGPSVNYRLRDWLISRQRYWGAPIPVIHCPTCGPQPVPDDQLPVLLPEVTEFLPTGQSPLATQPDFLQRRLPALRRGGHTGDGHDGHLHVLVVVLLPLPRSAQRGGAAIARAGQAVAAHRPVHGRR